MRDILSASVRLGVPTRLLADCLGASRAAVRNRAYASDGVIAHDVLQQLTGLTPVELDRLSGGQLTAAGDETPAGACGTFAMVRALLATPPK